MELPEIPQRELRNHSGRILRDVGIGRSYTITVGGNPVADLIPHRAHTRRTAVPRDEVPAAFENLPKGTDTPYETILDDSLYDPYDRAYRRGEFASDADVE